MLFYRNSTSEGASLNSSNFPNNKELKTKPVSKALTKNSSLLDENNNRTSFLSSDKDTLERLMKNSDKMCTWSCEKVGQYLDEVNLGQYKQVS